jgi:dynein heavy chain
VIFSQPDIQRQLPAEAAKFQRVDKHWKDVMRKTNKTPNTVQIVSTPGLLEQFIEDNKLLDQIQKSLEDYLETKRVAFPRFYFLSNDDLLEILSQTRDPQAVQPHLGKCFDNLVRLQFGDEQGSTEIQVRYFICCAALFHTALSWLNTCMHLHDTYMCLYVCRP